MGGILLLSALIAVFIVIFWYISADLIHDKTSGFLRFTQDARATLSHHILKPNQLTDNNNKAQQDTVKIKKKPF